MKSVLITGCSRGLGATMVHELLARGCKVLPHFRKEGTYVDLHKTPNIVLGDINEQSTRDRIAGCLRENDVDVYINNAAIYEQKPFAEHSEQEIIKTISTNLTSQILVIQRVYNWFLERGAGLIININSIAGIQPSPNEVIYSATKFGLKGFSQSLQVESIGSNIKIVDIFPGAMKTNMTANRKNDNHRIDPSEISAIVCDVVTNKNSTSLSTEIVVRKFISKDLK
jgi:short-subunit dehydrogenase